MSIKPKPLSCKLLLAASALSLAMASQAFAQEAWGPYNAEFPAGGDSLSRSLAGKTKDDVLPAGAPWSIQGWVQGSEVGDGPSLVAGLGNPTSAGRFLVQGPKGSGSGLAASR
jgi:hypothetical protein